MMSAHRWLRSLRWLAALGLISCAASGLQAQSVAGFLVAKLQHYQQTSSAAPVLDGPTPFQFVSVVFRGSAALTGGTLTFTGTASPRAYTLDPLGNLSITESFATQALMDAAFANGTYNLTMNTSAGDFTRSIVLFGLLGYPPIPRLTVPAGHWQNGSLVVDVTQDYTLTWNAYTGATSVDFIQLIIAGTSVVVQLPATTTSYTIPAGTLQPDITFAAALGFVRVAGASAADMDVGAGVAAFVRDTQFTITAVPEPSSWMLLGGGLVLFGVGAARARARRSGR